MLRIVRAGYLLKSCVLNVLTDCAKRSYLFVPSNLAREAKVAHPFSLNLRRFCRLCLFSVSIVVWRAGARNYGRRAIAESFTLSSKLVDRRSTEMKLIGPKRASRTISTHQL